MNRNDPASFKNCCKFVLFLIIFGNIKLYFQAEIKRKNPNLRNR